MNRHQIPLTNLQLGRIIEALERKPDICQTWGCQPILTVKTSGGKPMLLFFTAEYSNYNQFPQNQGIYVSSHPFRFMMLLNEGNADIMFDFNWKPENMRFSSILRAQEEFPIEAKGTERIWSFGAYAVPAGGPAPQNNASNWGGDSTSAHLRIIGII